MNLLEFINKSGFTVLNKGFELSKNVSTTYACDLLSIAMSKMPYEAVWVTVMANVNTIAVAVLTEAPCIIFAENISPDEITLQKASEQGVTLLKSSEPIFETALKVYRLIHE